VNSARGFLSNVDVRVILWLNVDSVTNIQDGRTCHAEEELVRKYVKQEDNSDLLAKVIHEFFGVIE
jgi:hypothetical protein